ncbi:hypothetical protein Dimus_029857 [Dionaea muscipula]
MSSVQPAAITYDATTITMPRKDDHARPGAAFANAANGQQLQATMGLLASRKNPRPVLVMRPAIGSRPTLATCPGVGSSLCGQAPCGHVSHASVAPQPHTGKSGARRIATAVREISTRRFSMGRSSPRERARRKG